LSFEVVVVGAGPAGSAAAARLARGGAKVLLVERGDIPRAKACGDGLTPRTLSLLEELGVRIQVERRIVGVRALAWADFSCTAEFAFDEGVGCVLPRFELDQRIARVAEQSGAELLTRTHAEQLLIEQGRVVGVRLRGERGATEDVRAPITILAEGAAGTLVRQAPIPPVRGRQTAFAVRQYFEGVDLDGSRHFEVVLPVESGGRPRVGYAWIFPMSGGMANVGIGYFVESEGATRLPAHLREFTDLLLRCDARFEHARPMERPIGAPIRIGGRGASAHGPGILLVGDSAGLANPFWAEGISRALESGTLAAEAALGCLTEDLPLSSYGSALADREPTYDRIAPSLSTIYRGVRHVARDLVPFFRTGNALARAFFSMVDADPVPQPATPAAEVTALEQAVCAARRRALRLVARDRPLYGEVLTNLREGRDAPASGAAWFLAGWCAVSGSGPQSAELLRAAVCFELAGTAAFLLTDLGSARPEPGPRGARGGDWLAAWFALSLADRILARIFAVAARLPEAERVLVSRGLRDLLEALAGRADRQEPAGPWLRGVAAREGALLGGATPDQARAMGERASRAAADERFAELPARLRGEA
jgi:geranylgeranyl reductase family protein